MCEHFQGFQEGPPAIYYFPIDTFATMSKVGGNVKYNPVHSNGTKCEGPILKGVFFITMLMVSIMGEDLAALSRAASMELWTENGTKKKKS